MEDKELVKRAQKGDKEAFGSIYKKYFQKVYRYCKFNVTHDELAKDISQETFVKAYKKIESFKMDGQWSIQAYLFAIARNLIIDNSRKKKEANIDELENLVDATDLINDFDRRENVKKVQNVLSKLDETDRQIVILRYFEELPSQEVAKILGIKDGALRVRTFRIMQKIKEIFKKLYGASN